MVATPSDIARFTTDGVLLTTDAVLGAAVLVAHPDARRTDKDREVEMFFVNPAHAQLLLNERFELLRKGAPLHDGVEVEQSLGIGTTVAIAPRVPCFTVIDADGTVTVARLRAYVSNRATDRFAVEVLA